MLSQPHVAELTVEDPAEAFEDLRDRNDLKMLMNNQQFMQEGFGTNNLTGGGPKRRARGGGGGAASGKMGPPVVKSWVEKWRVQLKIAGVRNHFFLIFS